MYIARLQTVCQDFGGDEGRQGHCSRHTRIRARGVQIERDGNEGVLWEDIWFGDGDQPIRGQNNSKRQNPGSWTVRECQKRDAGSGLMQRENVRLRAYQYGLCESEVAYARMGPG